MAQQTAVEWFIDESFKLQVKYLHSDLTPVEYNNLKEQLKDKAKEMEKQQIVKAVNVGFDEGCKFIEDIKLGNGEQYYTQTYGK